MQVFIEQDKTAMFKNGLWSESLGGTEKLNHLQLTRCFALWMDVLDRFVEKSQSAKTLLDCGNDSMMVVFYNTRLARTWKRNVQVVDYQSLIDRSEHYRFA